ncbi:SDR family NAD(P)-dependent oxidoreductase [Flavisphingomonas formosensis]|uniref:SDR family NAD(P)-dependent oxidoreductase n=1 Tax=Flavisphingomonas formosensis TaxID=861534 RepID=UPI001E5084FB|nr:SDR family NAD(P)-dependent oxidoreductase [Sphingomonas formosensis]
MSGPLEGQVALVTGSTRGLGRELAAVLAEAGCDIVVVGREAETGEITAELVRAAGRRALVAPGDVTDEAAMDAVAAQALEVFGRIDILVCTAGVGGPRRPVWESRAADLHACFDVNVLGTMLAMRAVLPGMIERRHGRVIVIGGTYGHKGVANSAIYAASKWALRGLVKSAALEAAPFGVTCNVIAPGGVEGERLRRTFQQSADARGEPVEAVIGRFTAGTALGRLVTGDDIAAAILHLAGEGGRMITGQDIIIDAGTIV